MDPPDFGRLAVRRRAATRLPGRPGRPAYSRTLGGRSRSNMWTVSTKRTVLVW